VGGTGGHCYPALALAQELEKRVQSISVLFAGGGLKNPAILSRRPYSLISSAPISLLRPKEMPKNLLKIAKGCRQSAALFHKEAPSLVVGFGSYYALPLLLTAKWKRIPYVLHEQNAIPGRVIKRFSKGALFTGIHIPESAQRLKGKCRLVGLPLRERIRKGKVSSEEARKYFSLKDGRPVVLIFGGSQGASGINRIMQEAISRKTISFQIIHFTGSASVANELKRCYTLHKIPNCVKAFEKRMDLAWQAADIAITRAGASSIAEQIEMEVPGILIPYPLAMDNHQEANADYFVHRVQGGIKFLENGDSRLLMDLIRSAIQKRDRLKANIEAYVKKRRSGDFATEILDALSRD